MKNKDKITFYTLLPFFVFVIGSVLSIALWHRCGLLYASQSEAVHSRLLNKMKKVEIKMEGISPHKKIKGM